MSVFSFENMFFYFLMTERNGKEWDGSHIPLSNSMFIENNDVDFPSDRQAGFCI